MLKVVFDSTTLVSAFLRKDGVTGKLLERAVQGEFELYLADAIIRRDAACIAEPQTFAAALFLHEHRGGGICELAPCLCPFSVEPSQHHSLPRSQ